MIFLSFLTMIYMMLSSGVAMEIHYCMGKKAGIDLYKSSSERCGRCGMKEKKGGCCNDQHKFFKLSGDHKNVSNLFITSPALIPVLSEFFTYYDVVPTIIQPVYYREHPPGHKDIPLFIRNCTFRI